MQSHTVRRITSAHATLSLHSLIGNGTLTQTVPDPASTTSPERSKDMYPSRPCLRPLCSRLALLLSLLLLLLLWQGQTTGQKLEARGEKGGSSEVIVPLAWGLV